MLSYYKFIALSTLTNANRKEEVTYNWLSILLNYIDLGYSNIVRIVL